MPAPNLSEIAATTIENRSGMLADNMTKNVALLKRIKDKGKSKPFSGGRTIVQELNYAENSTYKRYSGYEQLDISPSSVFTAAEFEIKQVAVSVSISGLEELQNSGPEAKIDLLSSRIENAEATMINGLGADVYSTGAADGGKQIGGLQLLVPDNPLLGTVGGISRATWSFWRSKKFGAVADGSGAVTSLNVQGYMRRLFTQLVRNREKPDLLVADDLYWGAYHDSLVSIQRITDKDMTESGFLNIKYMTADCVLDGGAGGGCPASHMYFLNTNYIHWRPHSDRNMKPLKDRHSLNQDATVKLIAWAGNLTASNLALQGVLIA